MNKLKLILATALLNVFAVCANAQQSDNVATATYGNATGNTTRTMTVALNHATDYVAFYLNLTLPEGTTVKGVSVKSPLKNGGTTDLSAVGGSATESTDFNVPFKQNGAKCNIVGYNYGNEKIVGESGEILFTITLETTEGVAFDEGSVECKYEFAKLVGESLTGTVTADPRLWGDVVRDGKIDSRDYQTLANIIAGKSYDASSDKFAADMVQDDKFNAQDYQSLANKIAGK